MCFNTNIFLFVKPYFFCFFYSLFLRLRRILNFESEVERAPRGKQKKFNPRSFSSEFIIILPFYNPATPYGFLAKSFPASSKINIFIQNGSGIHGPGPDARARSMDRDRTRVRDLWTRVRDLWTASGRASGIHGRRPDARPRSMDGVRTPIRDQLTGPRKRFQNPWNGPRKRFQDPRSKSGLLKISVILAP